MAIEAKDVPTVKDTVGAWLENIGVIGESTEAENAETAITIAIGDPILDGVIYNTALVQEIKEYFPPNRTIGDNAGTISCIKNRKNELEVIMKNRNNYFKMVCWVCTCAFILTGCSDHRSTEEKILMEGEKEELDEEKIEEPEMESGNVSTGADSEDTTESTGLEPDVVDVDWSEYFNGLNGAAVVYDVTDRQYTIYNSDSALTRSSPCSTFKIISSLIALENGIFEPEDSTREWSGEIFWNEDWNKDIDFSEAFRTSCVWYYRQVIDDIGKDMMQKELDQLQYGNCDISDWEGRLNTNNHNRALTGFWIESSLMISPEEQVEVMERIFGDDSDYSEDTLNALKQVMLVSEQDNADLSVYGKTGMGKANGIVVDAWFTGFAEGTEGKIYFCVHLGRTDGMNVSSSRAKEIAIQIVSDYYDR